jgi:hypothetical protein
VLRVGAVVVDQDREVLDLALASCRFGTALGFASAGIGLATFSISYLHHHPELGELVFQIQP